MEKSGFTRRTFLQGSAALAGMTALPGTSSVGAVPRSGGTRPNILFLYTEGQRADALGMAGNPLAHTPNMDRIGREGVNFRNAFCTNALCAPSRAVVLTGLYSHTTGALDNRCQFPLPPDTPLFTDLLGESGYEVALVGKAHLCNGARERRWDYYCGFNAPATDYYEPKFEEGRRGQMLEHQEHSGQFADDLFTDRAIGWLKEKREKPFCLLLWHQTPHAPFYRPRRYLDMFNGTPIPKPPTFDDDKDGYAGKPRCFVEAHNKIGTLQTADGVRSLEELVKNYYAGLAAVDDNIGRVLRHLEEAGQLDNTIIILASDHGFFLGEWRFYDKRFMHEPSIRVPMMIRYPAAFAAGTVVDEMVLNLDIAPTILEMAGLETPKAMQGKSVVGLAQKKESEWRKDWLYEYFEWPWSEHVRPHRGVRTTRYKYIHYYMDPQEYELYDLQTDPLERNNLYGAAQAMSIQQQLASRLEELRRETGDHTGDQAV